MQCLASLVTMISNFYGRPLTMPLDARHRGPHFAMPCISCNHDIEFLWQKFHGAWRRNWNGDASWGKSQGRFALNRQPASGYHFEVYVPQTFWWMYALRGALFSISRRKILRPVPWIRLWWLWQYGYRQSIWCCVQSSVGRYCGKTRRSGVIYSSWFSWELQLA